MYMGNPGIVVDVDGVQTDFQQITTELDAALWRVYRGTARLISPTGTLTRFMDGWLINGCPLNVVLGQGWVAGQREALYGAGIIDCPGVVQQSPLNVTQTRAPEATQSQFTTGGHLITPTGVQTPSQPVTVYTSSGPLPDFGLESPPPPAAAPMETNQILLYVLAGVAVLGFLRR